jgi:hypothetical protein
MTYAEWCRENGVSHAHCPRLCEHPQPFVEGGRLYCGKCEADDGVLTECVPCVPGLCGEG